MVKLHKNFIFELFKYCLRNDSFFEIAKDHIKYQYFPSEEYKKIWKYMIDYYNTSNKLLSIGSLSQNFENDSDVIKVLSNIKDADLPHYDVMLEQFETFIKTSRFIDGYDKLANLFNNSEKDKAFKLITEFGKDINEFTLKNKNTYSTLFSGFLRRVDERQDIVNEDRVFYQKAPTGIINLDKSIRGGVDRGDIFLFMAGSGVGKSKALKWAGLSNARIGNIVLHVQAEGTRKEAEESYDAAFMGMSVFDIENLSLSNNLKNKVVNNLNTLIDTGGEVIVHAYEQFDTASMRDIRSLIEDIIDLYGRLDVLIIDYLELIDPGDGKRYSASQDSERRRREAVANKFKDLCVEFKLSGFTATQSMDVNYKNLNNPEFNLTRNHVSEFKGMIKPFSYFVTLNQTEDELSHNIMRLYKDKIRKYKNTQKIVKIVTNYSKERFYDHKRTTDLITGGEVE